ncbi:hypothetical protein QMP26_41605 (plasmid) [Enterocloster clostridioformis]
MASRMIIEIEDGIINGIYTDCQEKFTVEITDPEDLRDPEREKDRRRLEYLIKNGGLTNLLEEQQEEETVSEKQLPVFDTKAWVLIKEASIAKTNEGRALQRLDAVYLDGFLYSYCRLSRYLRDLFRKRDPVARTVYKVLEPLRCYYDETYDGLCERLNSMDYDELAKPDKKEET